MSNGNGSQPAASPSIDKLTTTARFYIEINNVTEGLFTECSGLGARLETEPYPEAGVNDYVHLLVKGIKYNNFRLKAGLISLTMWKWFLDWGHGKGRKETIHVVLYAGLTEKMRFSLLRAFPISWAGPTLSSSSVQFAMEEVEFSYEQMTFTIS